jgi:hypothetical protein
MCVQWRARPIVETRRADRVTGNGCDNVAKCQERTATACNTGLQTTHDHDHDHDDESLKLNGAILKLQGFCF